MEKLFFYDFPMKMRSLQLSNSFLKIFLCVYIYLFLAHKAKLQVLKFEYIVRLSYGKPRIYLQLTGKFSLKLGFNSSLLLEYGHKVSFLMIKRQATTLGVEPLISNLLFIASPAAFN